MFGLQWCMWEIIITIIVIINYNKQITTLLVVILILNLNCIVFKPKLAEDAESFTLALESPTEGAKLDTNADRITIRIPANDAPIEFPIGQISVPENHSTVVIEVYRGLQSDGVTIIGPVNEAASVEWYLVAGSATAGDDYVDDRGMLNFEVGETKKNITVMLRNDVVPEQAENFTVHLANASQNAYLKPPGMATVILLANDDQHGVIAFGQHPRILDEDGARTGMFYVNRSAGTFGTVIVSWKISGVNASSVFEATSGMLTFSQGQNLKSFQVAVHQDSTPEETKEFLVQLYNVTGGARLENTLEARQANFYVRDSDDVYGIFEFAPDDQQRINMVILCTNIITGMQYW